MPKIKKQKAFDKNSDLLTKNEYTKDTTSNTDFISQINRRNNSISSDQITNLKSRNKNIDSFNTSRPNRTKNPSTLDTSKKLLPSINLKNIKRDISA